MKAALFAAALICLPAAARGPGGGDPPGWSLMTPEERAAHHERMRSLKDYAECREYMTQHHKKMEARTREKGKRLPWKGPRPYCDFLRRPAKTG